MADQPRSADQVMAILDANEQRMNLLAATTDPNALRTGIQQVVNEAKATTPKWTEDTVLYRVAISVLGVLALTAAGGAIGLVAFGKTIPDSAVAIGSAAVGALVGLFAPTPTGK